LFRQVWTGSANFTDGGIYGQANVGHIVRDYSVAKQYLSYWNALKSDPPGRSTARSHTDNDDESTASGEEEIKRPMDDLIEEQQPDLDGPLNSNCSMKTIFSPRKTANMLQFYADRMRDAKSCIHLTAP
jgi:phosphatidylserine/phosphatidylglycerophosphate/cardiolipin synthase-like enzyme